MFPCDAVARGTGEVTPGVHNKALSAGVSAVRDEGQNMAADLAAVSSPRPAATVEALNRVSSQQPVASVAGHLTAGAQCTPGGPTSRGLTGHLTVGQTWWVAPVRITVVKLRNDIFLWKVIVAVIDCGPPSSCEEK